MELCVCYIDIVGLYWLISLLYDGSPRWGNRYVRLGLRVLLSRNLNKIVAYDFKVKWSQGERFNTLVIRSGLFGGSRPYRGWEFFSSPPRPDRLLGPSNLLSNGH
jgi:hypothetical protein